MQVQVLGCSHQTSPLSVRERLAFGPDQTRSALTALRCEFPGVEAVLLSTCNRVELYTATIQDDAPSRRQVAEFFAHFHQLKTDDVLGSLYDRYGRDSVHHLFLVASSLDSMVVGEAQISSQVKQAYQLATQQESTGPLTHAIFQAATRVARRVANETSIHERRVSVPSVAVAEFVGPVFERLEDKRALVLGAGDMADETLRYLCKKGIRDITIVNRRTERAAGLASQHRGRVSEWEDRYRELISADLVVSATGAPFPIIEPQPFEQVRHRRDGRPLVILDLAVPRDFDPAIGRRPGVFLFTVDDLRAACERNRRERENELPKALQIIEEETSRFMGELNFREVAPVIQRLQECWQEPKEAELRRLLNKLPDLDEAARHEIRRSFDRLTSKLFHPPLESLRT
ncbi:MAG: glutamyl-tRNA reductase, partial [Planctomycetes bacterium]|nr:glutamyl-tRNA reductase [Planctomycetota bacterium]